MKSVGRFETTRWTIVLRACASSGEEQEEAFASLCRDYWEPVHVFIRQRGMDVESALDLTQEFFFRLLEKDWLEGLQREGGSFRSFLLTMLRRFLVDEYRRSTSAKRGGVGRLLSLDAESLPEPASPADTPEEAFDRRWALSLLDRAHEQLRADLEASGKAEMFRLLSPFLAATPPPGVYEQLAQATGMSKAAIGMAVMRMRARYREIIRGKVAETLIDASRVDEEMRDLFGVLLR